VLQLEEQLAAKNVQLDVDETARLWIADRGYDVRMGARPMARVIQEHLKRPLAEELLFGKLANGGRAHVLLGENDTLSFELEGREKATQLEPL
jgi:ATP-dependent Clp protease ATP-binding subunit ClpA